MAIELSPDTDLLAPLGRLSAINPKRPEQYYLRLVEDADPIPRVSAWLFLFERRLISEDHYPRLIKDCRFAPVRSRAFDHFESIFEHDLARQAAEVTVDNPEDARQMLMKGRLIEDAHAQLAAEERRFLLSGNVSHLVAAASHAEQAGGWRSGLAMAVRGILAFPQDLILHAAIFRMIEGANHAELMRELSARLAVATVFGPLSELTGAIADALDGDSRRALSRLDRLSSQPAFKGPFAALMGHVKKAKADTLHKLGQHEAAYAAYLDLNAYDKLAARSVNASDYTKALEARNALLVPPLPPDPRTDVVFMLGFPRSGTTLLENALAAHPAIETFEEIPSQRAALIYLERKLGGTATGPGTEEGIYLTARDRFYGEIDRRRRKIAARVLVDKLPIRSGDAKFLRGLFPERRYIFSIRHPYDVVLSCFRQRFKPNPAMENFRTIESTTRVYDMVMQRWFDEHTLDEAAVHYVRYEELVTNFQPVIEGALRFLGLDWSEDVLSFAEKAGDRAAKTPSYQKVRQGLSIGVQSAWKHYDFTFRGEPSKLLDRWVRHFGYEGL